MANEIVVRLFVCFSLIFPLVSSPFLSSLTSSFSTPPLRQLLLLPLPSSFLFFFFLSLPLPAVLPSSFPPPFCSTSFCCCCCSSSSLSFSASFLLTVLYFLHSFVDFLPYYLFISPPFSCQLLILFLYEQRVFIYLHSVSGSSLRILDSERCIPVNRGSQSIVLFCFLPFPSLSFPSIFLFTPLSSLPLHFIPFLSPPPLTPQSVNNELQFITKAYIGSRCHIYFIIYSIYICTILTRAALIKYRN